MLTCSGLIVITPLMRIPPTQALLEDPVQPAVGIPPMLNHNMETPRSLLATLDMGTLTPLLLALLANIPAHQVLVLHQLQEAIAAFPSANLPALPHQAVTNVTPQLVIVQKALRELIVLFQLVNLPALLPQHPNTHATPKLAIVRKALRDLITLFQIVRKPVLIMPATLQLGSVRRICGESILPFHLVKLLAHENYYEK